MPKDPNSFEYSTQSSDFFTALKPLVPKAIEIAHMCYEQVLIKDGRIKEGEYDKNLGSQGLFVSKLEIFSSKSGFKLEGHAFASTPEVKELEETLNVIQNFLTTMGVYDPNPCPYEDGDLEARIDINTMFFTPGAFEISITVRKTHDKKYYGSIYVSFENIIMNFKEAKSILIERAIIRNQTYDELLKKVKNAKTNKEKKETLEGLMGFLLKELGFEIRSDTRGIDNEIDVFAINESEDVFLKQLGNPVLAECKNCDSPMPAKAIRDFAGKLRDKNVSTGIIVSIKGITGTDYTDAKASIRNNFSKDKLKIIVIDEQDLESLAKGQSFRTLLRNKYYEISTL